MADRWQDDHDPLCPSFRAKDWQAFFARSWCQCDAIRAGRREGEADFQRCEAAVLDNLRVKVEALRDDDPSGDEDFDAGWYEGCKAVLALIDGSDDEPVR
jgi:hypothetical protein